MIRRDCTACVEYYKVGLTTLGQPRLSEGAQPYLIKDKGQRQGQGQGQMQEGYRSRWPAQMRCYRIPTRCIPFAEW